MIQLVTTNVRGRKHLPLSGIELARVVTTPSDSVSLYFTDDRQMF